jgi:hypothetical protein
VVCPDVFERFLEHRALRTRLLFGSDIPWGFLAAVEGWVQGRGLFFVSHDERLRGSAPPESGLLTYNTYHSIQALKTAFERVGLRGAEADALKEAVFAGNVLEHVLGE